MASRVGIGERFDCRARNWIENRTISLVRAAMRMRCGEVVMTDFPYADFLRRVENKCCEAGLGFSMVVDVRAALKRTAGVDV
jgi:hypothetical protein